MNMLAAQKIAEGMSPHAARRAARLQLGGIDQVTEQVRGRPAQRMGRIGSA